MTKIDEYRTKLRSLTEWDVFLLAESGLPGPRGNLELAQVVAEEGNPALFWRYLEYSADTAPVNSPYEFLAFCGAVGLGRLLAEGHRDVLPALRRCASDPRLRMHEAGAGGYGAAAAWRGRYGLTSGCSEKMESGSAARAAGGGSRHL